MDEKFPGQAGQGIVETKLPRRRKRKAPDAPPEVEGPATIRVKARFEEELRKAKVEDKIAATLDVFIGSRTFPEGMERRIYAMSEKPLYGVVAWVTYSKGSSYTANGPTYADALAVLATFPAVPLTLVKDGCTSFRPKSYADKLEEKAKERWQEETEVCGLLFKIEAYTDRKMLVEWTAEVEGVGLVTFKFEFAEHPHWYKLFKYESVWGYNNYGSKRRDREHSQLRPHPDMQTIMDDGEAVCQMESPIRWSTGDGRGDSNFTVYFVDITGEPDAGNQACAILAQAVRTVNTCLSA